MALLVAENLDKRFGAVVAAAGVAASFDAGERVSLIGSNGAGKTTFVNMITGYLKPDAGRIVLDGRDITALEPRTITRLGVARSFQIPQLYGDLSVLDNMLVANACHDQRLSFRLPAHRADAVERAERLLERFRLLEHRHRRVAREAGDATCVLFVEHDMEVVARYASRVVAFYAGRIVADGAPRDALAADDVRRYVTGELLTE